MNKICTSIEQSKKLIELGIDRKSSDMFYWYDENIIRIGGHEAQSEFFDIPAWSLSALLGLMPKLYEFENDPDDGGCQPNLCKGWDNNQWHIVYRSSIYITEWYDDPIDAAFEMVCWLKKNKKI
jgi:hypothetical protein